MKVIGVTGERDTYICTVNHTELEKLTDKYYNKLPKLKVGDELNLGEGHDFRDKIQTVCKDMVDAMKSFEKARDTLLKFANMVRELPQAETGD